MFISCICIDSWGGIKRLRFLSLLRFSIISYLMGLDNSF